MLSFFLKDIEDSGHSVTSRKKLFGMHVKHHYKTLSAFHTTENSRDAKKLTYFMMMTMSKSPYSHILYYTF